VRAADFSDLGLPVSERGLESLSRRIEIPTRVQRTVKSSRHSLKKNGARL
jgi:hypothetical protein